MQLMKSVLNFISSQFLSAMYHTLPTCWYEIYQNRLMISTLLLLLSLHLAYLHIRQVLDLDWRQVT